MTKEQMKIEAIERMQLLDLYSSVIQDFEKEDIVNLSDYGGMLYWLNDNQKELVKKFEEKYDYLVYHVIHNYTEFGELLALLYVSHDEVEWDYDKDDIKHGYAMSYVINIDDNSCSEFGSIGIKPQFGGLIRTA